MTRFRCPGTTRTRNALIVRTSARQAASEGTISPRTGVRLRDVDHLIRSG
jgi:hypothetical protein